MRLFLEGVPDLLELEELRHRARLELAGYGWNPSSRIYTAAGLSVRVRILYELPEGPLEVRPPLPATPATATLAWYWLNCLTGVLWEDAGQVAEVHARKEWSRIAGVEVSL